MSQSRQYWVLGGTAGALLAFVALAAQVALAPHEVRVKVRDVQAPLGGVWVSLEDQDVQTTDASGLVVLKGHRLSLDNAMLTVSNPSTEQIFLSQSLRLSLNWMPWKNSTFVEVVLPRVDGALPPSSGGGQSAAELDLPLVESSGELPVGGSVADVQSLPGGMREEVLSAPEDEKVVSTDLLPIVSFERVDSGLTSALLCRAMPLGDVWCGAGNSAVQVPLAISEARISILRPQSTTNPGRETGAVQSGDERLKIALADDSQRQKYPKTSVLGVPVSLKISARLEGRPLEGARIYMSRLRDSRVRDLGVTDEHGRLESKIPREFWGESLAVFHSCCAPKSFPIQPTKQTLNEGLALELQSGRGQGFLVQQEAYGVLRKVEQSEILSKTGKLAVSGTDGFAFYNSTKTPEQLVSKVVARNAKPSEFLIPPSDVDAPRGEALSFLVSSLNVYLPALAVIERIDGKTFSGVLKNAEIRRWRRDFMARLMKLSSMRVVISSETESRIAAAGESLAEVASRGWAQSHLAGEWDLLVSLNYDENKGEVRLSAIDSNGAEFFERKHMLTNDSANTLPESASRRSFDDFVTAVPFEASVVRQKGTELELTFPGQKEFGLKSGSILAVYQESVAPTDGHRLTSLAGFAVVENGSDGSPVRARLTHINTANRKTEVLPDLVRVAKVSADFFQAESARKNLVKLPLVSAGARQKSL